VSALERLPTCWIEGDTPGTKTIRRSQKVGIADCTLRWRCADQTNQRVLLRPDAPAVKGRAGTSQTDVLP
jgi:hypothetical protein